VSHQAILRKAGEDILKMAGADAVYTPNDGPDVPCRVHIDHDLDRQPSGYSGQIYGSGIMLKTLLHILGKRPERGETFTVGETTYHVDDTHKSNGIFVVCTVREAS
jgi:hypothetical protein